MQKRNQSQMNKTRYEEWEVTGPAAIGGNASGSKFMVEVHAKCGTPVDAYWRKRWHSEKKSGRGFLKFPVAQSAIQPASQNAGARSTQDEKKLAPDLAKPAV